MHLSRIPGRLAPELSTTEGDEKIPKIGRLGCSNDQFGPNGGGSGAGRIVAFPRYPAPAAVRSVVFDEASLMIFDELCSYLHEYWAPVDVALKIVQGSAVDHSNRFASN